MARKLELSLVFFERDKRLIKTCITFQFNNFKNLLAEKREVESMCQRLMLSLVRVWVILENGKCCYKLSWTILENSKYYDRLFGVY